MKQCFHAPLTRRASRETQWFNIEDADYKAFFKIITATKFSNDMKKCCKFIHTGKLENFHSLKLQYLPKSSGFTMNTHIILTMLSAIQHNTFQDPGTLVNSYDLKQWSKASKQYHIKKRNVFDKITFKKEIMKEVECNLLNGQKGGVNYSYYIRKPLPKTFHGETAPTKAYT